MASHARSTFACGVVAGLTIGWLWREMRQRLAGLLEPILSRQPFKLADRLSKVAKAKKSAPLRDLIPLGKVPGVAALGGGTPDETLFPIKSYSLTLVDGSTVRIDDPVLVGKAQQYMHDVTPGMGTVGYIPLLFWSILRAPARTVQGIAAYYALRQLPQWRSLVRGLVALGSSRLCFERLRELTDQLGVRQRRLHLLQIFTDVATGRTLEHHIGRVRLLALQTDCLTRPQPVDAELCFASSLKLFGIQ